MPATRPLWGRVFAPPARVSTTFTSREALAEESSAISMEVDDAYLGGCLDPGSEPDGGHRQAPGGAMEHSSGGRNSRVAVAHWIEHLITDQKVAGSNPAIHTRASRVRMRNARPIATTGPDRPSFISSFK